VLGENGLRIWVARGEGKMGCRREREGVGRKERIGSKGFRGKTFLFSKPFINLKLIRFQSKFEFQMILVAT
jgi:hypothetical protein